MAQAFLPVLICVLICDCIDHITRKNACATFFVQLSLKLSDIGHEGLCHLLTVQVRRLYFNSPLRRIKTKQHQVRTITRL